MECKDAELSAQDKADKVLIETSWNVKLRRQKDILVLSTSINRNIVECKGKVDYCAYAIVDGINRNIVECKGWKRI